MMEDHEFENNDYLKNVLESFDSMVDLHDSPYFQFLRAQLQLLLCSPNARRFDKQILILAAELYSISSAAYKMLRRSGALALPCVTTMKKLLSRSFQDANLPILSQELKLQQRLVNVLFDEVKLTQTMRFSGGHILGHATNATNESAESEILATHALVIEIICHYGGPRYILRVCPVAKLNSESLKNILQEAMYVIIKSGGSIISLICDNCPTNQGVYGKLGGPGKVHLEQLGVFIFLVFDYVHIFKNVRNNWITVGNQMLSFVKDGKTYVAYWGDVRALYEEDRNTTLRLTKLTHTAVFHKPLQRQSVPLVCQVFNEKTVAAMITLQTKLKINDGTIEFIGLITNWFKMLNVKDKFSAIHLRDNCRCPWTVNCDSFKSLYQMCDAISTCAWEGGRGRNLKLTKATASAFITSTKSNIEAATYLLTEKGFEYVLPGVFADEVLEKFFGKTRMRVGGNFYIDVVDVIASAKNTNLHALLKYDIFPVENNYSVCKICEEFPCEDDVKFLNDFQLDETQLLLSDNALKHKLVFIGGHLVHKFGDPDADCEEEMSTEFLDVLNRGGLSMPTFSTVHFVHSAFNLFEKMSSERRRCRTYMRKMFSLINAPFVSNTDACRTLSNILQKAYVLNISGRERELGCLRRKEKLSMTI